MEPPPHTARRKQLEADISPMHHQRYEHPQSEKVDCLDWPDLNYRNLDVPLGVSLLDYVVRLLADISEMVVHDFANCNHKNRPTVMQALSGKEPPIESLKLRSTDNTES